MPVLKIITLSIWVLVSSISMVKNEVPLRVLSFPGHPRIARSARNLGNFCCFNFGLPALPTLKAGVPAMKRKQVDGLRRVPGGEGRRKIGGAVSLNAV